MRYDRATALLVVDVQNDFADPAGALYVRGAPEILPLLSREADRARAAGATVVYTQDWHPPRTPHFRDQGGPWPRHCVRETWGAELHPELLHVPGALVLRKGTGGEDGYSAFSVRDPVTGDARPTGLASDLRDRGVRRVVVGGLATDHCVRATALDAIDEGFEVAVLTDGVRAVDLEPGDGDRALAEIAARGAELGWTGEPVVSV